MIDIYPSASQPPNKVQYYCNNLNNTEIYKEKANLLGPLHSYPLKVIVGFLSITLSHYHISICKDVCYWK